MIRPKYCDNGQSAVKLEREHSTTIPTGSTLQAFGSGSGEGLSDRKIKIWSVLVRKYKMHVVVLARGSDSS